VVVQNYKTIPDAASF